MSVSSVKTQENIVSIPDDSSIVLMTRDPHSIYAYWQVSESAKNKFLEELGRELWEKSFPVLKVTNVSRNESFFVRINEFSDNWYINVPDPNSLYVAEIGRMTAGMFFIGLASSNYVVTPGDSVSSNTASHFVDYRDLKKGVPDFDSKQVFESYDYSCEITEWIGLSSPELLKNKTGESVFGVSSLELFGGKISGQIGISSEMPIK